MPGHLRKARGLDADAVNEGDAGKQKPAPGQHRELTGSLGVRRRTLPEVDEQRPAGFAGQSLLRGGKLVLRHLERKDVVENRRDRRQARVVVELAVEIEVARLPGAAGDARLALGDGFHLGVALHLAFQPLVDQGLVRRGEQDIVDRLLLPVVTVAKLLGRLPPGKEIPGEVVVQVDKAGRDDATGADGLRPRREADIRTGRENASALEQDSSLLDRAVRREDGAGQGHGVRLRLRDGCDKQEAEAEKDLLHGYLAGRARDPCK